MLRRTGSLSQCYSFKSVSLSEPGSDLLPTDDHGTSFSQRRMRVELNKRSFFSVPLRCPPAVHGRRWACPDSVCPRRCRCPGGSPRAGRGGHPGSRSCHRPHDKTTCGATDGATANTQLVWTSWVCFSAGLGSFC